MTSLREVRRLTRRRSGSTAPSRDGPGGSSGWRSTAGAAKSGRWPRPRPGPLAPRKRPASSSRSTGGWRVRRAGPRTSQRCTGSWDPARPASPSHRGSAPGSGKHGHAAGPPLARDEAAARGRRRKPPASVNGYLDPLGVPRRGCRDRPRRRPGIRHRVRRGRDLSPRRPASPCGPERTCSPSTVTRRAAASISTSASSSSRAARGRNLDGP